ncbi:GDP-mannose 4,6-dehydratase [Actomonas aquatica]|uniref:GDP-mannose 4,6-dehydratase n=1 Tax=Actomonas aquatica TaxID=2866162 RepID=A0ABZ1CFE2_9BACT|nr:GDP-mannose 4,6-dehydratase [Opitutus sp. WL0086]WRQ89304.1 GDP-mannose 4,6-dehydratase [Opitutus sp. WL0086]
MAKIAIIGSNSFSGASFAAHCLREGHEVLGLSRSAEPARCFLPYRWLDPDAQARWHFTQADLNHDLDTAMTALDGFKPAAVVNFAAQGMVAQSWEQPLDWYRTNVMGQVALHDRLRHADWLEKYVHIGTPEVYGSTSGSIDETAPFNPSTPYAASRAACDLHLRTFLAQHKFPVVWTRAANVYGPGQQLYRILPRTALFIKLGHQLQLHGGGHSVRSFIHIDDVAAATLAIALRAPAGECYHLSTDRFVSIRELVELVCREMGADFNTVVNVTEDRPGKDAAYLLDSTKVRTTLGWEPTVSLEDGVRQTIAWINDQFEEISSQEFNYIHKA